MLRPLTLGTFLLVAPALALAQTTTTAKPSSTTPPAASATPPAASGSVAQYSSQSDAATKCAGDTVVWANPNSKALHTSGDRYFGKSKHGFYACEKEAVAGGYHLAGHHKRHAKTA